MDNSFYFEALYPLQDRVIGVLSGLETEFYLTGGTAASRGYLNHRFSDDLDFFVNDDARFILWADLARLLCSATSSDWELIRWIAAPEMELFKAELNHLGESLLLK
jgi:hypothetical protein